MNSFDPQYPNEAPVTPPAEDIIPPVAPAEEPPAAEVPVAPPVAEEPAATPSPMGGEPVPTWPQEEQAPNPAADTGWQQPATPTPPTYTPYQYTTGQSYDPYGWRQQTTTPTPPPKKRRASTVVLAVLAAVCVLTVTVLGGLVAVMMANKEYTENPSVQTGEQGNPNAPAIDIEEADDDAQALTTQSIIQMNLDCTVVITTYEQQASSFEGYPFGGGFYGNGNEASLQQASSATGIVMSEDGYIITNRHCVINENTNIQYAQIDVKTYGGKVYEKAEVIGVDSDTDLAVIKVNATGLTKAVFGDSSKLQLGDKVVALGNSGGLEWTPTQGIVSGLARDVYDDTGYSIKCLQTDAAINPGNSGGPLINAQGQVIGINSAKIAATGYESLGFSIPINEAKGILDSLLQYGYVKGRVSLGITGSTYTSTNSNYDGFQIMTINKDSSLANTQAQAGDIITHVDDVRVTDYAKLRAELSTHNVGDTVTLTLLHVNSYNRQVETIRVTCTLQESTGG